MKRPTSDIPSFAIPIENINYEGKTATKEEVGNIAENFKTQGQVYPIVVAANSEKNSYRLKAGVKRLLAAKKNKWSEIKAVIIPYLEPENEHIINRLTTLIESCQRNKLSSFDLAKAAVEIEEKYEILGSHFATIMGLSPGYTYNLKRWFRNLPPEILEAWRNGHSQLNQAEIERYSHMKTHEDAMVAWQKRIQMKTTPEPFIPGKRPKLHRGTHDRRKSRRASEAKILQLQDAIESSALIGPVKEFGTNLLRFVLGTEKDVPGITNYKKLPPEIIDEKPAESAA